MELFSGYSSQNHSVPRRDLYSLLTERRSSSFCFHKNYRHLFHSDRLREHFLEDYQFSGPTDTFQDSGLYFPDEYRAGFLFPLNYSQIGIMSSSYYKILHIPCPGRQNSNTKSSSFLLYVLYHHWI